MNHNYNMYGPGSIQSAMIDSSMWSASLPVMPQIQQQHHIQQQIQHHQQEIHKLASQLNTMGINPGSSYMSMPQSPTGTVPQNDSYYVASLQPTFSTSFAQAPITNLGGSISIPVNHPMATSPLNATFPGAIPNPNQVSSTSFSPVQSKGIHTNATIAMNGSTLAGREPMMTDPNWGRQINNVNVSNSLPLSTRNVVKVSSSLPLSTQENDFVPKAHVPKRSPSMRQRVPVEEITIDDEDLTDGRKNFNTRIRQQKTSPPHSPPPSDTSSMASSTSTPNSPGSSRIPTYSPPSEGSWSDASGPRSPDYQMFVNGEHPKSQITSPITNKPLQIDVKYPQHKCYNCMKKVYQMDKLGPVRDVVFHKGCFKCHVCATILTLRNFTHSQTDPYDLNVYCKSHQPLATEKGAKIGPDSVQIQSALKAPKQGKIITESERVPEHKYNLDNQSVQIAHARKAPHTDLQSGAKLMKSTWSKARRETYHMPPGDVVRHDQPLQEYDLESLKKHQVENYPDYDGS
ncbi:hypothetical protein CHS0354_030973 [Potamilus streckersoni]|uniref:LIM zinc-binding domain-containing protein n=1 Tax=Potamilus streckersoni TaxID=2493646 RepID=A0AAE0SF05_9BIVA|nr:hypothetical protein CHS0354_030973 [Potamilus streckersoni]